MTEQDRRFFCEVRAMRDRFLPKHLHSSDGKLLEYFRGQNARDYALFLLGLGTWRRFSEISALNVRDVAYVDDDGNFALRERIEIREHDRYSTRYAMRLAGRRFRFCLVGRVREALEEYLVKRKREATSLNALLDEPLFRSRKKQKNGEYRITAGQWHKIIVKAAKACGVDYRKPKVTQEELDAAILNMEI